MSMGLNELKAQLIHDGSQRVWLRKVDPFQYKRLYWIPAPCLRRDKLRGNDGGITTVLTSCHPRAGGDPVGMIRYSIRGFCHSSIWTNGLIILDNPSRLF